MKKRLLFVAAAGVIGTPAHADFRADAPGPKPEHMIAAYRLAECVVRKDPQGAQRLLTTLPGSKDNDAANRALLPALETCWRAQSNGNLKIGGALMRGAIAEVIYHRVATPEGQNDPYAAVPKDKK